MSTEWADVIQYQSYDDVQAITFMARNSSLQQ